MTIGFYILIFLISCFFLTISSKWVVSSLSQMAKYLGWKEFVVAFFIMAFASSAPNLFVGIISAFKGIPQLSFGDVMGGNLVDLTLVAALAVFLAKKGIEAESRTVQTTAVFVVIFASLPLLLIADGVLGRIDGVVLILCYVFYSVWVFGKKERFKKVYDGSRGIDLACFMKSLGLVVLGSVVLFFSAQGIISSASYFAQFFSFPIGLIGILIVGLGNSLPETFFSLVSVKRGQTWMILGNLMGGVINTATMVLGIVALIHPIEITDFSPYAIARFFLIIAAFLFFFCIRTGEKITKREAIYLLSIYILFLLAEVLARKFV